MEILQEYPNEVEHIFIPSCVVLKRCAGCCMDEMLQCTPTSTYNVTMEVSRNTFMFCAVVLMGMWGDFIFYMQIESFLFNSAQM